MNAAIEDVRFLIGDDLLASLVRSANDGLDTELSTVLDNVTQPADPSAMPEVCAAALQRFYRDYASEDEAPASSPSATEDLLEIHCPIDNVFYLAVISAIDPSGLHVVRYDEGNSETLGLASKKWRSCGSSMFSIPRSRLITSDIPTVPTEILQHFGNMRFMPHDAK